jgi:hypothetical protein
MSKKPKKKRPLNARGKRYAIARGRGLSQRKAAKVAGFNSKRAAQGVTGNELDKDPRVQKLMQLEISRDMDAKTTRDLLAGQARGEVPTKIIRGTDGIRVEHDTHAALQSVARIQGQFKDHTRIDFGADPESAFAEVRALLRELGVECTDDEIKAALERLEQSEGGGGSE